MLHFVLECTSTMFTFDVPIHRIVFIVLQPVCKRCSLPHSLCEKVKVFCAALGFVSCDHRFGVAQSRDNYFGSLILSREFRPPNDNHSLEVLKRKTSTLSAFKPAIGQVLGHSRNIPGWLAIFGEQKLYGPSLLFVDCTDSTRAHKRANVHKNVWSLFINLILFVLKIPNNYIQQTGHRRGWKEERWSYDSGHYLATAKRQKKDKKLQDLEKKQ